mgnify:CR=1 FL=1
MEQLKEHFYISVTKDHLIAKLEINEEKLHALKEMAIEFDDLKKLIAEHQITYGVDEDKIKEIVENFSLDLFPAVIAKGIDKVDGKDGKIKYEYDMNTKVDRSKGWDFREVMRIPTVKEGEKLATLIPPTEGKHGITVYGKKIPPRPGKPALLRPGKNVTFNEKENCFYATAEGQITVKSNRLHVYTVYEVPESLSMKIGNIDFKGTVIIRGDVPSGFTVKATGDIKIFGLVEAANIIAEGTIYVSEGFNGLKTGVLEAGEDIHVSYINQGKAIAGDNIYVDNSILHSECTAVNDIICRNGNIIGGTLSSGRTISGKDIGNRLNTITTLSFGAEKRTLEEQKVLEAEIDKLSDQLKKLYLLQRKFSEQQSANKDSKTMLKLNRSVEKTRDQLTELKDRLSSLNVKLGNIDEAQLIVTGKIYPNVVISFGKYQRTIDREFEHVVICMDKNEIAIKSKHY